MLQFLTCAAADRPYVCVPAHASERSRNFLAVCSEAAPATARERERGAAPLPASEEEQEGTGPAGASQPGTSPSAEGGGIVLASGSFP